MSTYTKFSGKHLINGLWTEGAGEPFGSHDPSTGEIIWKGKNATKVEVDTAIEAARHALPMWSELPIEDRIQYLQTFKKQLSDRKDALAKTIALEVGKPLWESKGEVGAMIAKIDISIEAYSDRCKENEKDLKGTTSITRHKPHGVAAVFGAYNFPGHLPNGHIVPALLAGNTIVLKPSELTPLVSEQMIQIWETCNLPKGVINLIQGGKETGILLANHNDIDALFFTGSWNTGKILAEEFGKHPEKILALEMGGNNPLIIGEISDLKVAAYLTIQSAFITSGQRCTCARRLLLPTGKKGDEFLEHLQTMMKKIQIGDFREDPEPFMGPLISENAADHVLNAQKELAELGGQVLIEAKKLDQGNAFLSPGLIDVTNIPDLPDREVFGPLLQVIRVSDFEEAIKKANATEYGLCAGILTDHEEQYREFYRKARAGIINWNTQLTGASSAAPFGGIGHSGNHRPSAYYAADYCAFPVASMETTKMRLPSNLTPGIDI